MLIEFLNFDQSTSYACMDYHNETPLYNSLKSLIKNTVYNLRATEQNLLIKLSFACAAY
jgi:hypothetical protein